MMQGISIPSLNKIEALGSVLDFGGNLCKKIVFSRGGCNFEKRRNSPLGNVVRNKHTRSVLNFGGKKSGEE